MWFDSLAIESIYLPWQAETRLNQWNSQSSDRDRIGMLAVAFLAMNFSMGELGDADSFSCPSTPLFRRDKAFATMTITHRYR